MKIPYDLSCWYLNRRRIVEVTGSALVTQRLNSCGLVDDNLRIIVEQAAHKDAIVNWMQTTTPSPLRMILTKGQLSEGLIVTHNSNFYFRGVQEAYEAIQQGKNPKLAIGYSKISDWRSGGKLQIEFHAKHLTSMSSFHQLSGQKRMFVLGLITSINNGLITAIPYVIANVVHNVLGTGQGFQEQWNNHLEIHIDQIENFNKSCNYDEEITDSSLELLRDIPEREVKTAFAEIIGEPNIPKDWGGETSDLFTTKVLYNEKRISTAFIFKGKSKFKPLKMADLGKNGDQISRLYNEPASLLVLQHCHQVTNHVRVTMRAFAQQMNNPRLFCIIDGYDTIKILKSYKKCGL